MKCLFEDVDNQPENLKEILEGYDMDDLTYESCAEMLEKVKSIGYTFDYGLDAIPYNLVTMDEEQFEPIEIHTSKDSDTVLMFATRRKHLKALGATDRFIDSLLHQRDSNNHIGVYLTRAGKLRLRTI